MPRSRSGARPVLTIASILAVLLAAAIAGFAVFLFVGPFRDFEVGFAERRHLDEIPIDRARACGSVESIHSALDSFNLSYTAATLGVDEQSAAAIFGRTAGPSTGPPPPVTQPPWPTIATKLDASAARLDLLIAAGIPNFPPQVQQELEAVRASIADGRAVLPRVVDSLSLNQTRPAFDQGQLHAGYASDLVGDQCAVPLGA